MCGVSTNNFSPVVVRCWKTLSLSLWATSSLLLPTVSVLKTVLSFSLLSRRSEREDHCAGIIFVPSSAGPTTGFRVAGIVVSLENIVGLSPTVGGRPVPKSKVLRAA